MINCTRKSKIYCVSSISESTNVTETIKDEIINDGKKACLGYRHLVVFFGFMSMFFSEYHRQSISVAMVAMVNYTTSKHELNESSSVCLTNTTHSSSSKINIDGEFNWSSEMQGYILGISFLSMSIFRFPAGKLIEMWGEKRILWLGHTMASIIMIILPFASWFHELAVIILQFFRGAVQTVIIPCVYAMMGKWLPPLERGLFSTIVFSGFSVGGALGGMFSGLICDLPELGWPYVFYLDGALNLPLAVFIFLSLHEKPVNHPNISVYELNLILDGQKTSTSKTTLSVPWKKFFTSGPVYAAIVGMFGMYWMTAFATTAYPIFMGTILHYGLTKNGILSSLPSILRNFCAIATSLICTWLQKKKYVGVDKLRKGCNSIGILVCCGCFLGAYFSKCDATTNVIFFTLSFTCLGITYAGSVIACVDMSPNFSGPLMAFVSGISTLAMFILPVMVGKITTHQTLEEWHEVFFICIGVLLFTAFVFQFFGSAEVQSWNSSECQHEENVQKDIKLEEAKY